MKKEVKLDKVKLGLEDDNGLNIKDHQSYYSSSSLENECLKFMAIIQ